MNFPARQFRSGPVDFRHVDVFSDRPYGGNSLAVFPGADGLRAGQMLRITQELRHFESVFLTRTAADGPRTWRARVFDLEQELEFAGHPLIGAAAVLHSLHGAARHETWTLRLPARTVEVRTEESAPGRYASRLDQGPAAFLGRPDPCGLAARFCLEPADLDPALAPELVSTGLRYLVLPVRGDALARARVAAPLDAVLAGIGAQFAYLLDAGALEGRHWTNDGRLEDVATGSGAGCAAAYLRRHGVLVDGEEAVLRQGRFTGRTGEMAVSTHGSVDDFSVHVGGTVSFVAEGRLLEVPRPAVPPRR